MVDDIFTVGIFPSFFLYFFQKFWGDRCVSCPPPPLPISPFGPDDGNVQLVNLGVYQISRRQWTVTIVEYWSTH
jgi:hypothetical protein